MDTQAKSPIVELLRQAKRPSFCTENTTVRERHKRCCIVYKKNHDHIFMPRPSTIARNKLCFDPNTGKFS